VDRNGRSGGVPYLWKLADTYYNSVYTPPRKPFDFYTSIALTSYFYSGMSDSNVFGNGRIMFYDAKYGITMLSKLSNNISWDSSCSEYVRLADKRNTAKRNGFKVEEPLLKAASCQYIPVFLVQFKGGGVLDKRLRVLSYRPVDTS
jgi:hypothetical protein